LEVRNARINLELLGAICRTYLPNVYGVSSSRLHGGLPTDRLVAEWHLNSARVKSRLESALSPPTPSDGMPSLEIPLNIQHLKANEPETAARIQSGLRERMTELFSQNFFASRLAIDTVNHKATYLFESFEQTNPVT
jgi:predicted GNAT superfamily acetyltransferase